MTRARRRRSRSTIQGIWSAAGCGWALRDRKCVFLSGIQEMELPVAHGEGKFVVRDADVMRRLEAAGSWC